MKRPQTERHFAICLKYANFQDHSRSQLLAYTRARHKKQPKLVDISEIIDFVGEQTLQNKNENLRALANKRLPAFCVAQ